MRSTRAPRLRKFRLTPRPCPATFGGVQGRGGNPPMPDDVLTRPPQTPAEHVPGGQEALDAHDLAGFGYKQELRRVLGVYSSFAVAFSYISPSTGIFTLYALGLWTGGVFFLWTLTLVALCQLYVDLYFLEVNIN